MAAIDGREIVLSSLVGSWAANLNTPQSDEDWKYFVCPTFDDLYTGKMFSSASISSTFDYDVHDIRQLGNLLWKANISFISVLFGKDYYACPELLWIFNNPERFATMNLPHFYSATMGMHHEKMSTLHKGTGNTQHLIDQFGYDTKQATHALRCLMVLTRFVQCGIMRYALWFTGDDRDTLLKVKSGFYFEEDFLEIVRVWKESSHAEIRNWYNNQPVNEEAHCEMEEGIKEFIRIRLKD